MDAGGLLEGDNDVGEKALFDFEAIGGAAAVADEEVADDALALRRQRMSSRRCCRARWRRSREEFWPHVAEDHLGGLSVVPRERASPHGGLFLEERTKVGGGEVAEVEDFHGRTRFQGRKVSRFQSFKVVRLQGFDGHTLVLERFLSSQEIARGSDFETLKH